MQIAAKIRMKKSPMTPSGVHAFCFFVFVALIPAILLSLPFLEKQIFYNINDYDDQE